MFACLSNCPSDEERLKIIGIRLMRNKNKHCLSSNLSSVNQDNPFASNVRSGIRKEVMMVDTLEPL